MTYQDDKIHITYYLTLFLPLILMGPMKFSQTHKPYTHLMVTSLKKLKSLCIGPNSLCIYVIHL